MENIGEQNLTLTTHTFAMMDPKTQSRSVTY